MTISKWLEDNWKHVTIREDVGTLRVPAINVDLTIGLISTNNLEEFSKLVFHLAPVGIIVDEIPQEYYEGQILKLRNLLTKMVVKEQNFRLAEKWLKILERRDKDHWSEQGKQKELTVKNKDTELKINITDF